MVITIYIHKYRKIIRSAAYHPFSWLSENKQTNHNINSTYGRKNVNRKNQKKKSFEKNNFRKPTLQAY